MRAAKPEFALLLSLETLHFLGVFTPQSASQNHDPSDPGYFSIQYAKHNQIYAGLYEHQLKIVITIMQLYALMVSAI